MIHARFSLPHVENHSCRLLWSAVLISVLRDLCAGGYRSRERRDAELWVGKFPSGDFCTVCHLADLHPNRVHDWFSALIALPIGERRRNAAERLGCKPAQIGNALMVRQQSYMDAGSEPDSGSNAGQGPNAGSSTPISITQRRDRVAEMFEGGIPPSDMPDIFAGNGHCVPMDTVRNDIRHLRRKGRIDYMRPPANSPPVNPAPPSVHHEEEYA